MTKHPPSFMREINVKSMCCRESNSEKSRRSSIFGAETVLHQELIMHDVLFTPGDVDRIVSWIYIDRNDKRPRVSATNRLSLASRSHSQRNGIFPLSRQVSTAVPESDVDEVLFSLPHSPSKRDSHRVVFL